MITIVPPLDSPRFDRNFRENKERLIGLKVMWWMDGRVGE